MPGEDRKKEGSDMASTRIAFVGLGVMGFPMAGHLAKAGHDVTVYNRTQARAEAWAREHGGKTARTPAEAAKGAEIVFSCVGNDDDVRSVVYGDDGILAGMAKAAGFEIGRAAGRERVCQYV